MRAVLDPNVLVSALLSPTGTPARIVLAWAEGRFELVVSPDPTPRSFTPTSPCTPAKDASSPSTASPPATTTTRGIRIGDPISRAKQRYAQYKEDCNGEPNGGEDAGRSYLAYLYPSCRIKLAPNR